MGYILMTHPDIPDGEPAVMPQEAFDDVWVHKGWENVGEAPADGTMPGPDARVTRQDGTTVVPTATPPEELHTLYKDELVERAQAAGIVGADTMTKDELIETLGG